MELLAHLAGAFAVAALLIHVGTSLLTAWRCRRSAEPLSRHDLEQRPAVTIIRPVCGLDAFEEATLRSTFELDYPQVEVLLCCASAQDPVVPLAQRLIAEHPHVQARLLIGDDRVSENPKLNNVIKGWRAASHAWIVITDSNVLLPRDYIDRLFAAWTPGTGLVSAPPIGARPTNLWAELECAFLNGYQARWQFTADSLGFGFAQGKTLFWRRIDLERAGGIHALGAELAEDAASTKVVREQGLNVRLVDGAFPQPLGVRALPSVWSRQLRWARLRRATFPLVYSLEIFSGLFAPLACCVLAAWWLELPEVLTALLFVAIWLGSEYGLTATAGWPLSWRSPLLWLLRDIMLPVLWLQSWLGNGLSWRGNDMSVAGHGSSTLSDWLRRA
jgi:ceramide glucosyltransferase